MSPSPKGRTLAADEQQFRLAPPPDDISQPVSVAQSFGASMNRGRGRPNTMGRPTARAAATASESAESYRLSDVPPDAEPAVAVAQAMSAPVRQLQVVEIASAIAGAVMTRILDNEGDISWELDQLNGVQHPDGKTSSPSSAAFTSKRVPVNGIFVENYLSDQISADFEITFQYNGASVGYIQVSSVGTNDAVGWGLTVKENIMPDPNTFTTVPPSASRFSAIKVRFEYHFSRSIGSDAIALRELTLFGNGAVRDETRWTQD
jgi:hypothetical protein